MRLAASRRGGSNPMSYDSCPHCDDDKLREVDEDTVECTSCRTPLDKGWCSDSYLDRTVE